jgi:hypothetical protein
MDHLPPPPNPTIVLAHIQLREYLVATLAVLHTLFFGYKRSGPVFGREVLDRITPANGERLFCLLLIGLIRQSTVSAPEIGDSFCEMAAMLMPQTVVPASRRLAAAMRLNDLNRCESTLHDVLEQLFKPLDAFKRMHISACTLPYCAMLSSKLGAGMRALG